MVLVLYFSKITNELSGRDCSDYLDSLNLTLIFFNYMHCFFSHFTLKKNNFYSDYRTWCHMPLFSTVKVVAAKFKANLV